MNKVFEYQKVVVLNRIEKIVDRRFKSGYRSQQIIASYQTVIPPNNVGTTLTDSRIEVRSGKPYMVEAFGNIQFNLDIREREL